MAITDILIQFTIRFGQILAAPAKQLDMLWILIPIYLNWIFTDFYQERKGTSFGNAITNGVIQLWVGVDWIRQTLKSIELSLSFVTRIVLCIISMIWGFIIVIESVRAKPIAHYIGRVREVSYFMIVATPIFYGVIEPNLMTIGAILFFFPIFYGLAELVDRLLPAPPGEDETSQPNLNIPELTPPLETSQPPTEMPPLGKIPKF